MKDNVVNVVTVLPLPTVT